MTLLHGSSRIREQDGKIEVSCRCGERAAKLPSRATHLHQYTPAYIKRLHNLVECIWNSGTYQSWRVDITLSDRQSVLSELHCSPWRVVHRRRPRDLSVRLNDSIFRIADAATRSDDQDQTFD